MDDMNAAVEKLKTMSNDEKPVEVLFTGYYWIYPDTIEDFCLFNFLFDGNRELINKCLL